MAKAANGSARVFRPFFEISPIFVTRPHIPEWSIARPSTNSATTFSVSAAKANGPTGEGAVA
jgi:hypothetical protein